MAQVSLMLLTSPTVHICGSVMRDNQQLRNVVEKHSPSQHTGTGETMSAALPLVLLTDECPEFQQFTQCSSNYLALVSRATQTHMQKQDPH